tara:strand:+ start:295 stop:795 length:501 start_codon:yes stop_codon:yes gene_type:complete
MAKNTGKNFENEIRRSLKGAKCFWFRIQDTNDVSRYVKKAVAEKQPGDFFAVYRSRPILIECKTTRNLTAFPLYYGATRSIPKHQVDYGRTLQRNGGISLLLLRRDEPRNKTVYALTPEQVAYLYRTFGKDRKSVPWKWIEEHSTIVERLAKPIRWNLVKLFTALL